MSKSKIKQKLNQAVGLLRIALSEGAQRKEMLRKGGIWGFAGCRLVQEYGMVTATALLVAKLWGQQMLIGSTGVALIVFKLLCKYWL